MQSNPLTFAEIEAFARLSRIELSAWEADLYCRLDDAVLAAWRGETPANEPKPVDPEEGIPVADTPRLREMLKATAARTRLIEQAKAQAGSARRSRR